MMFSMSPSFRNKLQTTAKLNPKDKSPSMSSVSPPSVQPLEYGEKRVYSNDSSSSSSSSSSSDSEPVTYRSSAKETMEECFTASVDNQTQQQQQQQEQQEQQQRCSSPASAPCYAADSRFSDYLFGGMEDMMTPAPAADGKEAGKG